MNKIANIPESGIDIRKFYISFKNSETLSHLLGWKFEVNQ